jgi:hypothetical protein
VEITDTDKQAYVAAVLGGQRFTKEYGLLGGKLRATFRGLTARESAIVIRQLYNDSRAERIRTQAEFYRNARQYRLALGLARLYREGNPQELPEAEQYDLDWGFDSPDTGLIELWEHIMEKYIVHESLLHILLVAHERFDRFGTKIEAAASKADF